MFGFRKLFLGALRGFGLFIWVGVLGNGEIEGRGLYTERVVRFMDKDFVEK